MAGCVATSRHAWAGLGSTLRLSRLLVCVSLGPRFILSPSRWGFRLSKMPVPFPRDKSEAIPQA